MAWLGCEARLRLCDIKLTFLLSVSPDIRHPEESSLLRKPRDPKKKKKKLEEAEEDDLELEGPLLTPGSGELMDSNSYMERKHLTLQSTCYRVCSIKFRNVKGLVRRKEAWNVYQI